jgi:hypothetical protein
MRFLVTTDKHVNYIWIVARQPSITIEKLLKTVFSVLSAPRLYSKDPRQAEWVRLQDIRRTITTWAREAEESPLLEAVAREGCWRQQARKNLARIDFQVRR